MYYLGVEKLSIIIKEIIEYSNILIIIADIFIKNSDFQIIKFYDEKNSEIDNSIENYNNFDIFLL